MISTELRESIRQFILKWNNRGKEDEDDRSYWIDILERILNISNATDRIDFQKKVIVNGSTKRIDAYIPETRILIEQKSFGIPLDKKIYNSDNITLTPYEQAKRYNDNLPVSEKARYIVTSNFSEIWVYDMDCREPEKSIEKIYLQNFQKEFYRLEFLINRENISTSKELEVSVRAGELIGILYDKLYESYSNPDAETLKSLNILCVRLVFCLWAEDAGLFKRKNMFYDYLFAIEPKHMRRGLIDLFRILNTKDSDRDPDEEQDLLDFPYVNGGLFANDNIRIPQFTDELKDILINQASKNFDWSEISPTIFGAIFESTLNPETRRSGGMHYTSLENIHKVIDPLFLNNLYDEFNSIKKRPRSDSWRTRYLKSFQDKLASLRFLDPAAGSGNFLTETYLSLRRLENEVLRELKSDIASQMTLEFVDANEFFNIKVSINQFYGIEINDFAVTVAKTALWIAEAQMLQETLAITTIKVPFLPLTTSANIAEKNALTTDWNEILPASECSYIMGNPPFIGARMMPQGSQPKKEIEHLFGKIQDVQDLDYVTGWYKKAAEYIQNTGIEVGFVSTNSICQGAQVPVLWNVLLHDHHVKINFAHQTFQWDSESNLKAHVYVIIVGFSTFDRTDKLLYTYRTIQSAPRETHVSFISPYLLPVDAGIVCAQKNALCDVPKMNFGNQPRDGGHFIITGEERKTILSKEPALEKWLRPYIGADEFIKGKKRWCLWLKDASPADIANSKILYHKVAAVKEFRLASKAKTTNGYAKVPHLFAQITQPDYANYLIIPRTSGEKRRYIPIGFMPPTAIASDAVQIVPNASYYHFGILTSNVHMAWMRTVCGRLKSDYRYSKELVYNTFPWPEATTEQKERIVETAKEIIRIRNNYSVENTMAVLYDPITMPVDLEKAHRKNDIAVMNAYGLPINETSELTCVAELMKRYQKLISAEKLSR